MSVSENPGFPCKTLAEPDESTRDRAPNQEAASTPRAPTLLRTYTRIKLPEGCRSLALEPSKLRVEAAAQAICEELRTYESLDQAPPVYEVDLHKASTGFPIPEQYYRPDISALPGTVVLTRKNSIVGQQHRPDVIAFEWAVMRLVEQELLEVYQLETVEVLVPTRDPEDFFLPGPRSRVWPSQRVLRATPELMSRLKAGVPILYAAESREIKPAPDQTASAATPIAAPSKACTKGKNISARIRALLDEDIERYGWSGRQFAERLDCQESTVKESNAWDVIMEYRRKHKALRITRSLELNGGYVKPRR